MKRNWLIFLWPPESESRNVFIMDTSSKENIQLFSKNSMQPVGRPSFKTEYPSSEEKQPCCGELKVFLGALSFVYFAKALAEGYLKSTITQIERRFDIPSSLVGVIDGSFEIGNLLVITFVSYFGAKLHRPKIIGAGCLIMGVGTLLIAMPHFFMEQYRYERYSPFSNSTFSISPCFLGSNSPLPISVMEKSQSKIKNECEIDASSSMWAYVFLGNLLRGIGETPIQPLGIAYLDDFANEDNAAFYIGCVQTVAIIGPIFGFLLGSLCAKLYVDIGFVNLDHITITPKDPQWVGAWWLGYLIAGSISLLAAVPFWYLPKSLPRPRSREDSNSSSEKSKFITDDHTDYQTPLGEKAKIMEMARDFLPSLKSLFGNPVYFSYLCASAVQFNSLFGMVTYKPKYIEQQYGQSSSKANFVIDCNSRCKCSETKWEPMCGANGITYASACLAGCQTSTGSGKTTIFNNCTCVGIATSKSGNSSGMVGRCQKDNGCPKMFLYFLVISVITSYTLSLGGIPGYILLLRCIKPQLKSFALGIYTLAVRVLAGIPAPVYFGVLIDTSCLKWGFKRCGSRGSCRLYDSNAFRHMYLGLTMILGTMSIFLSIAVLFTLKKKYVSKHRSFRTKRERTMVSTRIRKENCTTSDHLLQPSYWPGKETQL
ncbi:solute carrier organic anion transporter family member 1C1 isoform X8 [Pseudorca crassidens]|uniref:solute carrier organic anion transporter family member 1C1 isoform X8 n=1 Tax=Pseudorca crassidens TaxID=82174 RepID=UPI00352BDEA0